MDMLNVTELPDDPALLKRLLVEQVTRRDALLLQREEQLAQRNAVITQRDAVIEQIRREAQEHLDARLDALRELLEAEKQAAIKAEVQAAVAAVLRRFYGPRSERFDPQQLVLFGVFVDTVPLDAAAVAAIEAEAGAKLTTRRAAGRHNHGRGPLPEHLPRVRIEHDLLAFPMGKPRPLPELHQ